MTETVENVVNVLGVLSVIMHGMLLKFNVILKLNCLGIVSRCTKRQIMRVEILCSKTSHIIHHWKDLSGGC